MTPAKQVKRWSHAFSDTPYVLNGTSGCHWGVTTVDAKFQLEFNNGDRAMLFHSNDGRSAGTYAGVYVEGDIVRRRVFLIMGLYNAEGVWMYATKDKRGLKGVHYTTVTPSDWTEPTKKPSLEEITEAKEKFYEAKTSGQWLSTRQSYKTRQKENAKKHNSGAQRASERLKRRKPSSDVNSDRSSKNKKHANAKGVKKANPDVQKKERKVVDEQPEETEVHDEQPAKTSVASGCSSSRSRKRKGTRNKSTNTKRKRGSSATKPTKPQGKVTSSILSSFVVQVQKGVPYENLVPDPSSLLKNDLRLLCNNLELKKTGTIAQLLQRLQFSMQKFQDVSQVDVDVKHQQDIIRLEVTMMSTCHSHRSYYSLSGR